MILINFIIFTEFKKKLDFIYIFIRTFRGMIRLVYLVFVLFVGVTNPIKLKNIKKRLTYIQKIVYI